ncbi:T-cell surface antigen CD2-like isoform X2 [Danio rerio]|uniref:T-cell surface antigen CD2-like isoform X2 n=1 Tax=Danio rerio TaxID=7955 RepID=A0AC58JFZ9_DANRE
MSCQHNLLLLFLCDFAALTVSAQTCGEQVLEGTSCSIYGKTRNNEKAADIRWAFTSSNGNSAEWKKGSRRKPPAGLTIEEDGSLRFISVDQSNTGTYKYKAFNANGQQIGDETVELKVYAKTPKPTVKRECTTNSVILICDTANYKDLNIFWYEDDKILKDETKPYLTLMRSKMKKNKGYSCSVQSSPVSREHSNRITVSSSSPGLCLDFWVMLSILAGGGALLLLLLSVLICCACRSYGQHKKNQPSKF